MPIQVEGPDGQLLEFPDGTDRETMRAAMAKRYGGPAQPSAGALPAFLQAPEQPKPDFSNVTTQAPARPSLFRMDSDFRKRAGLSPVNMAVAAAKDMFGSRQGSAEYLAKKVNEDRGLSSLITGGAQVVPGDNGDPMLRLPDGTTYRMNDPGLDSTDLANVSGNIAAFFSPAAWVSRVNQAKNVGLLGRAGTQALAAGGTDAALQATFDNGRIDPLRTAAATVGGAGGEVIGSLLGSAASRLGAAKRSVAGQNANEARGLLSGAGADPAPQAVSNLSKAVPEIRAGANPNALLGRELYGFQYTRGQRATDPARKFELLSQEELLRQKPGAAHLFGNMDRSNQQQLSQAVTDIGERLGGRPGATPAELAQGAASRVRAQADELGERISDAYTRAGEGNRAAIDIDSVSALPDRLRNAVRDFDLESGMTAAKSTLENVRTAVQKAQGIAPGANTRGVTLRALESQRRIISNNINAAANKADKSAMVAIKREFDSWMDEAVDGALISGDAG